jgi:hypothetical protein
MIPATTQRPNSSAATWCVFAACLVLIAMLAILAVLIAAPRFYAPAPQYDRIDRISTDLNTAMAAIGGLDARVTRLEARLGQRTGSPTGSPTGSTTGNLESGN